MKRRRFCIVHPGIAIGAIALFATACTQSSANIAELLSEESNSDAIAETHAPATEAVAPAEPIRYETYELDTAIVHTVSIPASASAQVTVVTSAELTPVDDLAASVGAIAAINAGFFDPNNQQTTSFIRLDGEVMADPRTNDRLMQNPDLATYLDAILNRSEFRHYRCTREVDSSTVEVSDYAITPYDAPVPPDCHIRASVGAGPQLLPQLTSVEEGFLTYNTSGQVVRDAIGSLSPNARSAVGITADNTLVLAMVAQRGDRPTPSGLSLPDFANFLASIGVEQALNLDGGSSTSLFYQGQTYYGRLNTEGQPIERSVKSVILILD